MREDNHFLLGRSASTLGAYALSGVPRFLKEGHPLEDGLVGEYLVIATGAGVSTITWHVFHADLEFR